MYSFSIDNLVLLADGRGTAGFILESPIEGLESPEYRMSSFSRPGRNGITISSEFYDKRLITLKGSIKSTNSADFENYRQQLSIATSIKKDDGGYPTPTRLNMTTLSGKTYFVDVYFDKPIFSFEDPTLTKFMLTAVADNPFIFSSLRVTSSNISPSTGGGYIVPMIAPYISASSVGGSVSLLNNGTVEALPTITLYGKLTNPAITNETTGKTLRLLYTIASGNTALIDMYNQTITLNSSSSLIGTKTSDSDWWSLAEDNNVISITTSDSSDSGYAIIEFNPPYIGI